MNIAILEICTHTHYSAINGLIKTYSTDPTNKIVLYTIEPIAKAILENEIEDNTHLVIFEKNQDAAHFLKKIEEKHYDVLHICTIEQYYKAFANFKPNVNEIIFHVHNIDIWFDDKWENNVKNLFYNIKHKKQAPRTIVRFVRDILVRNPRRHRILDNIQKKQHRFIVHSQGQKKYLSNFIKDKHIVIFPFAINEGIEKPLSLKAKNDKIRICIPGIVTEVRRDYSGLFKILETIVADIKDKIIFDFLGYIEKKEPELLHKIQNLEKKGLEVVYYTSFVYGEKYDAALEKADILLNNQKVVASHTTKYGVTKESGLIFNMIRGSKPGIFPLEYQVDKEFDGALIYYNSADELKNIILGLANGHIKIEQYKTKMAEVAQHYTPHNLYERLVRTSSVMT